MSPHLIGLLLGGFIPAALFALSGIGNKIAVQSGMAPAAIVCVAGLAVTLVGAVWMALVGNSHIAPAGAAWSLVVGATWGMGVLLVSFAIHHYGVPLSQLVPLYNMNTLIAVALSLWLFAEWKQVQSVQVIAGSLLVLAGGVLVARA